MLAPHPESAQVAAPTLSFLHEAEQSDPETASLPGVPRSLLITLGDSHFLDDAANSGPPAATTCAVWSSRHVFPSRLIWPPAVVARHLKRVRSSALPTEAEAAASKAPLDVQTTQERPSSPPALPKVRPADIVEVSAAAEKSLVDLDERLVVSAASLDHTWGLASDTSRKAFVDHYLRVAKGGLRTVDCIYPLRRLVLALGKIDYASEPPSKQQTFLAKVQLLSMLSKQGFVAAAAEAEAASAATAARRSPVRAGTPAFRQMLAQKVAKSILLLEMEAANEEEVLNLFRRGLSKLYAGSSTQQQEQQAEDGAWILSRTSELQFGAGMFADLLRMVEDMQQTEAASRREHKLRAHKWTVEGSVEFLNFLEKRTANELQSLRVVKKEVQTFGQAALNLLVGHVDIFQLDAGLL
ncbi:hypothetical protein Esti_001426 [Eimeria stiedai]